MKKALQISIAKTLFTIEDDAYAALDGYLASVKSHFAEHAGRDEIVADIESRIAEQLLESKEQVVTLPTVERILKQMGRVEDFDGSENADSAGARLGAKKLYRNPDDRILAGVASGLAAYLGINALWTRIAFFVLAFFNGIGILIYGVMWLIVPEAKTASQKLEMMGSPVTLETLSETVNERLDEIKGKDRSRLARILSLPFVVIAAVVGFIFRSLGPVLRVALGAFLVIITIPALIGLTLGSGFLMSSELLLVEGLSLQSLMPGTLQWLIPLTALIAALIPVLFVLFAGISILRKKSAVPAVVALSLLGVWILALIGTGFGAAKIASGYQEYVRTAPAQQEITTPIALPGAFTSLSVRNGMHVRIEQSTSTRLVAKGREKDMQGLKATVQDGVLVIDRVRVDRDEDDFCLFCSISQPDLVLYTTSLGDISADNGAVIDAEDFPARNAISVSLDRGAYVEISVALRTLSATITNGSSLSLRGSVDSIDASIDHGSRLAARNTNVKNADLTLDHGSGADINASATLKVRAESGSYIRSYGDAEVTDESDSSSSIFEE